MSYFFLRKFGLSFFSKKILKKERYFIIGIKKALFFSVGDILEVSFSKNGLPFVFEGILLGIRKKSFKDPNISIILRNIISNVGLEFIFSYFYNRIFFLRINDFKKKFNFQRKSKLFFLRLFNSENTRVRR